MSPAAGVLTVAVHAYRYGLRPIIGSHCRFHPHCSDYALEALASHGATRGTRLTPNPARSASRTARLELTL